MENPEQQELREPTKHEIQIAVEQYREEYLRHEADCIAEAKRIESIVGKNKAFHPRALLRLSHGDTFEKVQHKLKVLKKIGLVGTVDEKGAKLYKVVFDRTLRLKFMEHQIGKFTEVIGEYQYHEGALLAYEEGKRAPERKPGEQYTPYTESKSIWKKISEWWNKTNRQSFMERVKKNKTKIQETKIQETESPLKKVN